MTISFGYSLHYVLEGTKLFLSLASLATFDVELPALKALPASLVLVVGIQVYELGIDRGIFNFLVKRVLLRVVCRRLIEILRVWPSCAHTSDTTATLRRCPPFGTAAHSCPPTLSRCSTSPGGGMPTLILACNRGSACRRCCND